MAQDACCAGSLDETLRSSEQNAVLKCTCIGAPRILTDASKKNEAQPAEGERPRQDIGAEAQAPNLDGR